MPYTDTSRNRLATRLAFLVAGFGIACWAPLVPFAKERLAVDDAMLGMLLLCLSGGSVGAMLLTGFASARYGNRPIILAGCLGLSVILPFLTIASTPPALGFLLATFGASLGSLNVAMNIHAVEVERAAGRSLMSGFHAQFSVGGFAGSTLMTFLLSIYLNEVLCAALCSGLMLIATALTAPRLLRQVATKVGRISVAPRGIVLLLAALAGIAFLAEGAVLDWGGLLITRAGLVPVAQGGIGYVLFSIAMATGRLCGDWIVASVGDRAILFWGSILAIAGFVTAITAPIATLAMVGFLLIGLGASNIVPVLFRRAGTQNAMPSGLAVATMTTVGYAGILVGPAAIGFIAKVGGLAPAFGLLAASLCLVTFTSRIVTANGA